MTLTATASLAGGGYPQSVQIVVAGLTVGSPFLVTGSLADGTTWTVRGGNGQTATASTQILADTSTPINAPITYTVSQTGWSPGLSAPITVPYSGRYVLQSLDGRTTVQIIGSGNGSQRSDAVRTVLLQVPGRTTPVVRWDVTGGQSGQFDALLDSTASLALRSALETTGPLLALRTDGTLYDFPASAYLVITSTASATVGVTTDRIWTLAYRVITDPEPSIVVAASTWTDFDSAYAAQTWDQFDTYWSTLTWDDFDAADWSTF